MNRRLPTSASRRGGVLVMALVCLVILGVLQVLVVKAVVADRQVLREQAFRQQARWLAEAGVERAAARLMVNADYRGETWELPAEELSSGARRPSDAARVEIEVESAPGSPKARIVRARAAYPRELPQRVVYEKQVTIALSPGAIP
jgi:Tfp pilus assembly protein PilX